MKLRALAVVCLLSLVFGFAGASLHSLVASPPPAYTHNPGSSYFFDVTAASPHNDDIGYLKECGVVTGYWDGTYRPQVPVTREQMATYIARALAFGAAGGELLIDYDYVGGYYWGQAARDAGWITQAEFQTFAGVYYWLGDMVWAEMEPLGYPNPYKGAASPPSPDAFAQMAQVKLRILREHPEAARPRWQASE